MSTLNLSWFFSDAWSCRIFQSRREFRWCVWGSREPPSFLCSERLGTLKRADDLRGRGDAEGMTLELQQPSNSTGHFPFNDSSVPPCDHKGRLRYGKRAWGLFVCIISYLRLGDATDRPLMGVVAYLTKVLNSEQLPISSLNTGGISRIFSPQRLVLMVARFMSWNQHRHSVGRYL